MTLWVLAGLGKRIDHPQEERDEGKMKAFYQLAMGFFKPIAIGKQWFKLLKLKESTGLCIGGGSAGGGFRFRAHADPKYGRGHRGGGKMAIIYLQS
eukprot:scaffold13207_cov143-Cylindrotheca_fusiformis.AAC.23